MNQPIGNIKQVLGYCIICGKDIPQNIDNPFCEECFSSDHKPKPTKEINGKYCHYCETVAKRISYQYPLCKECTPYSGIDNSEDDYYQEKVNKYRNMSLIDRRKIKPLWKFKVLDRYKPSGILKELEITEILRMVELSESKKSFNTNNVLENEPNSNRKIMSILKAWENGIHLYPPNIKYGDPFVFGDGRHRCLAAKFLGAKTIPVFCINTP